MSTETNLDVIKNIYSTTHSFKNIAQNVEKIASLATASPIMMGVRVAFVLFMAGAFVFMQRILNKVKKQYAEKLTEAQRRELNIYIQSLESKVDDSIFDRENDL